MRIETEALAYWYLRLNGCLTITNFIVHSERHREGAGTDADIVGVRFPHRREMVRRPLEDEEVFLLGGERPLLVIAEVKKGLCDLNGPWTERTRGNINKVLSAIGVFPTSEVDKVAEALYERGRFENDTCVTALFVIGARENAKLRKRYPAVPQILWPAVLRFIHVTGRRDR